METKPFTTLVFPTSAALAALTSIMFITMLFDVRTQRAVTAFNKTSKLQRQKKTWADRLFPQNYHDRRLLIVNRLVWLELVWFVFTNRRDLALLSFLSFAISTIMLMLMMKRLK